MIKLKIRRFIAVLLGLTIVLGQSSFTVSAQANEDQLTIIKEFMPLEEEVREQTVPIGTEIEALNLPESLTVSGYIYDDTVTTPSAVMLTIDDVNWRPESDYGSTIPADYVFVPDLSDYVVQAELPTINIIINDPILEEQPAEDQTIENPSTEVDETLNEEGIEQDLQEPVIEEPVIEEPVIEEPVIEEPAIEEPVIEELMDNESEIDLALIQAGLDDRPQPLTLDDLFLDLEIEDLAPSENKFFSTESLLFQGMMLMSAMPVETHPATIIIGDDNENNAHTGKSDGDINSCIGGNKANYPIEVSFTLDQLPTESAYIAIKALDVDEEAGEKDYVFINNSPAGQGIAGHSIGALSGNNNQWNTSVLEIPLSKLKLGKNYVSISISQGWYVTIDWMQLILDGGEEDANVSEFSIKLGDAVQNGNNVEISSSINIVQSGTTEYYTEYMLNNATGDNLASYFGSASSNETASLSMPLNSPSGTYTITGLIKDQVTEMIKSSDTITFDFVQGEVPSFGPKMSYILSPSTLTNGNVSIQVTAENTKPDDINNVKIWYGGGDITDSTSGSLTIANQSVSENGEYIFTTKYTLNEVARTSNYTVEVSNIDKTSPTILVDNVTVIEDTDDSEVLSAIDNAITVTDNISLPSSSYTLSPTSGFASTLDSKTITINAIDTAGNETSREMNLSITPKPLQLIQEEITINEADMTAPLLATLNYTGGLSISDSGFVWSVSQNPTYEVCNGKTSTGVVAKGENISALVENIAKGITYYSRAYVKVGETFYYSDQKSFGIGAPLNGSFSVSASATSVSSNGGLATFTISRPSNETEGRQTVYYRTVNGTAIGSTHFAHKTGTIVFEQGEYTKTVGVTVNGVAVQYNGNAATAYQNIARNFYLEIYKVDGGATINTKRAEKTIAMDNAKRVYAEAFNQYNLVGVVNNAAKTINDGGFDSNEKDIVNFSSVINTNTEYLDVTANHYALKFGIDVKEYDDGYQYIKIINNGVQIFYTKFEHNTNSGAETSIRRYTFPMTEAEAKVILDSSRVPVLEGTLTDNSKAINIGKNKNIYIQYDASGSDDDDWYKDTFEPYIRVMDTSEPQLIGIGSMAGGTYNFGDEVYISLVYDEVIGSASGVTINTNLSDTPFSLEGGLGTNVLVFKGFIDKDSLNTASVIVNSINGSDSIKDLADYSGTPSGSTTGDTTIEVNTIRPIINFTNSTTGTLPRHSTEVVIEYAISAKYAWTQSAAMPVSEWMSFDHVTGDVLTEKLSDGIWYLHVLATHANGNTLWEKHAYTYQQPSMNVSTNNTNWAQSRDILLTVSSSLPVTITMTGPSTHTYSASQTINVTENGTYVFTLTDDYGSYIVKSVDVTRLDRILPIIMLDEYNDTDKKYTALDFGVSALDEGSGLANLEYTWSDSNVIPSTGWLSMALSGGVVPTYSTVGTAYLHIRATDFADNIHYACSKGYIVVNNIPPTIEATYFEHSEWHQDNVPLTYTVNRTVAPITYINAADTVMQGVSLPAGYPYTGSIEVSKNGLYSFLVIDENGLSATKDIVINYIDKEAPSASFGYVESSSSISWGQDKTVTINATDKTSPIFDTNGLIVGYGGSGISSIEVKEGISGTYTTISNGSSIHIMNNASYYIKVTDIVGNHTEYILPISGIDTTNPSVHVVTPDNWQNSAYEVIVTYSDDYSGIASAQYAITNNNTEVPTELFPIPGSGNSIQIASQGINYIYYVVTDKAGNEVSGWSNSIKIDTLTPRLEITPHIRNLNGEIYTSGDWTNEDVAIKLNNTALQISGTSYEVAIGGGGWEPISGDSYTISETTNATYRFRAVSGAQVLDESEDMTVRIQKTLLQDIEEVMLFPTPNSEDNWFNANTTIVVDKPVAEDGMPAITVLYKLWNDEQIEPIEPSILNGTAISIPTDGIWTLKIWTKDEAGNNTIPLIENYYVDTTEPVIQDVYYQIINEDGSISEPQDFNVEKNYCNQSIRVTVEASDALSGPEALNYVIESINQTINLNAEGIATFDLLPNVEGNLIIDVTDKAGNSMSEVNKSKIALAIDDQRPNIIATTPENETQDQSITPVISFTANEPLFKGDGYLSIYKMNSGSKVMDIHSGNNRVKLSNDNKTVTLTLPEMLLANSQYYIVIDEGFVIDYAGNELSTYGNKNTWYLTTVADISIPDNQIIVFGYTVDLISKNGAAEPENIQTLTAIMDKQVERQHNIIAKASYSENDTDYYVKLRITPSMSATPELINVTTSEGTAMLSDDKKHIEVLVPQSASEAIVTISLGSEDNNKFSIKVVNSSYRAIVETTGEILVEIDESNLLNSVDLSEEMETSQNPDTTVDVTLKMVIEQKDDIAIPNKGAIEEAVPGAKLMFLDITIEKVVVTTIGGNPATTEIEHITATQQPIVVIINIPEALRGGFNYQIVREHNGVIDILPATVIENGTKLRFETDRFSTYSIAYTIRTSSSSSKRSKNVLNEKTDSIVADVENMTVDLDTLNLNKEKVSDISVLLPYYIENDEEIVVGLSNVIDHTLKWIAIKNRTYGFKYNAHYFDDIENHWAKEDILFCTSRELFSGTEPNIFSADEEMTRGMFLTVIGRLWKVKVNDYPSSNFDDVYVNEWYAPYVEWAVESQIASGYGNGLFGPNDPITREQMAVIMANFAEYANLAINTQNNWISFDDHYNISQWALKAVKMIQEGGIIEGKSNNLFKPKGNATRAEVAAVIKRFIQNVVK